MACAYLAPERRGRPGGWRESFEWLRTNRPASMAHAARIAARLQVRIPCPDLLSCFLVSV